MTPEQREERFPLDWDVKLNGDVFIATGDDLDWLIRQLAYWPTRIDDDKTTNMSFLMGSAARTLQAMSKSSSFNAGIEKAAEEASLFIITRNSIHPDVEFDDLSEQSRMIAHATCQHVAAAIRALAVKE